MSADSGSRIASSRSAWLFVFMSISARDLRHVCRGVQRRMVNDEAPVVLLGLFGPSFSAGEVAQVLQC